MGWAVGLRGGVFSSNYQRCIHTHPFGVPNMPRHHSKAQQRANHFERCRHSSLSISQFCLNEQIAMASFNYWRKRLSPDTPRSAPPIKQSHTSLPLNGLIHFTIEARGVKIECRCDSFQAIDSVLAWATGEQVTGFQQLIVPD
jgi:hypothetical protein